MSELEKELEAAARSWGGRIRGFLGRFIVAFLAVILVTTPSQWAVGSVWSVIISAAVTALTELSPSIPWQQVLEILDQHGILPQQVDYPSGKGTPK